LKENKRSLRSYALNFALKNTAGGMFSAKAGRPDKLRLFVSNYLEKLAKIVDGVQLREGQFENLPVQWVSVDGADKKKLLLYFPGGGFFMESPRAHVGMVGRYLEAAGISGVIPSYRLAPEHPFPAGADDCLFAYKWVLEMGYAPEDIVVAGDSAGGNLALVTLQQAKAEGLPMPSCAFFLSPLFFF